MNKYAQHKQVLLDNTTLQSGKIYKVGWDGRISPLGYNLLSQHASLNGITTLQQVSMYVCYYDGD